MFNLYGFNIDAYIENPSFLSALDMICQRTNSNKKQRHVRLCYLEILKQVFHFIKGLNCWVVKGLFQIVINLTFQSIYS